MSDHGMDDPSAVPCLFGAGGHGRVVAMQLWRFQGLSCVFADANRGLNDIIAGKRVIGRSPEDVLAHPLLVTIGDNGLRRDLQSRAEALGARMMALVVDPTFYLTEAEPGPGSQILAGAIVNAGARIGRGVIVNSRAVVEHDCTVGDFCHLAPGCVIGGGVTLGAGVLIGTNATVLPGVSIVSGAIIGAGAVVTETIADAGTYVGVPARRVNKMRGV